MHVMLFQANRNWGGGENRLYLFCRELIARGHKASVVTLPESALEKRLKAEGIPVFTLDPRSDVNLAIIPEIITMLRDNHVDIIDMYAPKFYWTASTAARMAGIPVILTRTVPFRKKGMKRRINRLLYSKLVDRTIAMSRQMKQELMEDYALDSDRVEVIYSGIELSRFRCSEHNSLPGRRDDELRIGVVSRLDRGKGLEYLVDAIPTVLKSLPMARFFIAGTGVMDEELKEKVRALRLEAHVVFEGFRNDIPEFLSGMDITVMPSAEEGMPMSAIESMAASVPVVAASGAGLDEVIDDMHSGVIVRPRDATSLAEGIIRLLQGDYRTIGNHARTMVEERISLPRVIDRYEALLETMLHQPASQIKQHGAS